VGMAINLFSIRYHHYIHSPSAGFLLHTESTSILSLFLGLRHNYLCLSMMVLICYRKIFIGNHSSAAHYTIQFIKWKITLTLAAYHGFSEKLMLFADKCFVL
jgi:hypothetical protein